jgi:hypothetical protein
VDAIGTGFLSLPSSASEIALGQNPLFGSANWANPALGESPSMPSYLDVSYGNWLSGVRSFKLQVRSHLGEYKTGYRVRHVSLNDLEYRTERPTDEPLASFGASGTAVDFHFNKSWENFSAGAALRWVYMDMFTESSQGFALDVGGIYSVGQKLKIGASILNLGSMSKLDSEAPTLPVRVLGGVSMKFNPGSFRFDIAAHTEFNSHVSGLIAGVSAQIYLGKLTIYSGFRSSENVLNLSGGLGLSLGIYRLNYGLLYGTHQLGLPQMIDLSIMLP